MRKQTFDYCQIFVFFIHKIDEDFFVFYNSETKAYQFPALSKFLQTYLSIFSGLVPAKVLARHRVPNKCSA